VRAVRRCGRLTHRAVDVDERLHLAARSRHGVDVRILRKVVRLLDAIGDKDDLRPVATPGWFALVERAAGDLFGFDCPVALADGNRPDMRMPPRLDPACAV
jgi:hypothetical protein